MVFQHVASPLPIHQFRGEIDRLLSGFLGGLVDSGWPLAGRGQPAVNVWEQDDAVLVEMELPGVGRDQLEISVVGNELSVKLQRREVHQEKVTYHRRERPVGSFARVLRLPVEVDADKVEAELTDGVLCVTLPKSEAAKPRKIHVTGSR